MKRYRSYRKSGEGWLGQVPEHWQPAKVKETATPYGEKGRPDLPLLSVYRDHGVVERKAGDENYNVIPEDLTNYKVVRPGQLVLNKMKTWQGSLGVSEFGGIVSPAYIVCNLHGGHNPRFIHYLLRCQPYVFAWKRISYGVRCDQWDMRYADFKQTPLFLPARSEQDAIVAFLEAKERDMAAFIANKRRMIELLQEQKTALINHAVTRGLNPNAPRKPSVIPWLGDIPKHWMVCQLRRVAKFVQTGSTPTSDNETFFENGTVDWFTPGDFNSDGLLIDSARKVTTLAVDANEVEIFPPGTVMLVGIGATVGKVGLTQSQSASNQQINAIGFDAAVMPQFAVYFLIALQDHIRATALSATLPILNQSLTKALPFLLPGRAEQSCIVSWLDDQSRKIVAAIATAEREIELMEEYRTALIAAAVTGKIDVRN